MSKPERKNLRAIYSHHPEPERYFDPESCWLTVGPFASHMDQPDVCDALEAVIAISNGFEVRKRIQVLEAYIARARTIPPRKP